MEHRKNDERAPIVELRSLAVEVRIRNDLNDKKELEDFADMIKQCIYQDYKIAYGRKGDSHEQEAKATLDMLKMCG